MKNNDNLKRVKNIFIVVTLLVWSKNQFAQTDTLNQKDTLGLRQGYWIFYGSDMPEKGYPADGKIEEGFFKDDRKTGVWITYHTDGITKRSIVQFQYGRPGGYYEKYYENGLIKEKGTYFNAQYHGLFQSYYENGCLQTEKFYDATGKQDVNQTYYYDNCDTAISDHGSVNYKVELLEDSTVARYRYWPDGCPNDGSEDYHFHEQPNPMPNPKRSDTYFQKSINENGDILMDGEFKGGKLWNGRYFIYDSDGILVKIEIWKNGAYHSDGQLY